MARDDYGEFGGNGSVEWTIDVDDATRAESKRKVDSPRGYIQSGRDEKGDPAKGDHFRVSVKAPEGMSAEQFRAELTGRLLIDNARKTVYFYLAIEKEKPGQIRISWPYDPDTVKKETQPGPTGS